MKNNKSHQAIGVFDSGIGGLSVVEEIEKILPKETIIYYGDNKNSPYGEKSKELVKSLSAKIVQQLIEKKVKAIVIACNTATSVAVKHLRENFDIPIIGMEPALKPAVEKYKNKKILVLATKLTLEEDKFVLLHRKFEDKAKITTIAANNLVEIVEQEITDEKIIYKALEKLLYNYRYKLDALVLGCTHFVFLKKQISNYFYEKVEIIDGNSGTVKQLKKILKKKNLLANKKQNKNEIYFSLSCKGKN